MDKKRPRLTFTVNVRLEQVKERELPDMMVYVFDATGQFLDAKPLPQAERGSVKLELPPELAGTTIRVIAGPAPVHDREEVPEWMGRMIRGDRSRKEIPSLAGLTRIGGYEKRVRLAAEASLDIAVLPHDWTKWLLCPCTVRGRLVKKVPLPDGSVKELGVCHACVKIYEVDKIRWLILHLPEHDLFRLRDDLLRVFPPIPPPPPEDMMRQAGPMAAAGPGESPIAGPTLPLPPPESHSIPETKVAAMAKQLPDELAPIIHITSASQLRQVLIAKAEILGWYICALEWIWYWFHKDLIKWVCTDEQGRFETTIWYHCTGDKPDLYFKAVQCIGGTLHTLYDPGVACHTHWNYVCGTEVVLETDDPAAITCVPPDPVVPPAGVSLWVMPYAIGAVRLDQIKLSGLTDFGGWIDRPFGGRLGFRMGYSSGIPYNVAGMPAYYRWLYNKLDDTDSETEWREFASPVADTVVRHYVDYENAHPELPPTFPVYPLGPTEKDGMHVYEFKPHQPPQIPGHTREWPVDDWFADIYSGILESANLPGGVEAAAGKYKIRIEIYDKDGSKIIPGPGSFDFIVPIGLAADGVTILTRKAFASEIASDGFDFYVHIDNNKCEAEIYEASVNGNPAGPCGFIGYKPGDDVRLAFKAKHENGFARFKFTVVRGSTGHRPPACAPANPGVVAWANAPLVTDSPVNGFARDASSVFTKYVDESAMLNGCVKAAFGENLYVEAAATNGWIRLWDLDASAVPMAFALEPGKP